MMFCQTAVAVSEISQVGEARREANRIAALAGLDEADRGRASIIASELATNLARYAVRGEVLLRTFSIGDDAGIELLVLDRGPGMSNVARCLEDGYSSGGTAGNGLGAVRRLANEFDIYSASPGGTVVVARVKKSSPGNRAEAALAWGAVQRAAPQQFQCGDDWRLSVRGDQIALMVADGLGHGPQAAEASNAAAALFETSSFELPADFLNAAHRRLTGSRGAAIAIARIDAGSKVMQFAGIGNVAGSLRYPPSAKGRGLLSHNGTVGVALRKVQNMEYECPPGALLILHSDGLQSRWDLEKYNGLSERHPALIAAVLYRDFCRGRDDVTVCVVRRSAKMMDGP